MEKNVSKFDEKFIKAYIIEADVEYPKDLHNLRSDLPFLSERMKIKAISLYALCVIKKNMLFI